MATSSPAVNSQQPVNSGCATCPKEALNPCDVDELTVKVEYEMKEGKEDKVVTKELTTNVVKRRAITRVPIGRPGPRGQATKTVLPYPGLSYSINEMLARYDFVIEVLADHPVAKTIAEIPKILGGDDSSAKKKAKIHAKSKFSGLKCEGHEHGVMRLKYHTESVLQKVDAPQIALPPVEAAAMPYPLLDGPYAGKAGGGKDVAGILYVFEFIGAIFASMTPREVEVVAQACGRRAKGDTKARNHDLRALVRVFRKDTWTVGLKVPALGEFKQEASGKKQLVTGQKEGEIKDESHFFRSSNESSAKTTTKANGNTTTEYKRESWSGSQGSEFSSTKKTEGQYKEISSESKYSNRDGSKMEYSEYGAIKGLPIREQVEERMKHSSGFDFVLACNGKEVPIKEEYEKIKKAIEAFAKVIGGVQEAFKKAPQVGWKFTFEISAFEGSVVLEFTPKPAEPIADGRFLPVKYTCEGKIELEIIKLKIALSFGVQAEVLDSGLVLKIEGSIEFEVKVNFTVSLDSIKKPEQEIEIEGKYVGEIKVVGYVSLVGKTVADAKLSVEAGFEFKNGKLVFDISKHHCELKGELRTKPITLSGKIVVPWWFDKKIDPPKELLPGQLLHKFG